MAEQDANAPSRSDAQASRPRYRLSRKLQVFIVLGLVAVGAAAAAAGWLIRGHTEAAPSAGATASAESASARGFQVTDKQLANLRLQAVKTLDFQPSAETEGKIALDDDLVTSVFSPYTGRVTHLMARTGDTVQAGDPLFAVQATELAQAQNDLISAAASLRTARAQLNLAQTNEKRQHALYLAQGAALKDWQQSQVDLATAQGGLNTSQIGLAAVRSRLRILGKSDADIDAIEQAPDPLRLDADTLVRAPISGTVVTRQVGLGQNIVSASSGATTPVFTIGNSSKVWLLANAREEDAPLLHKGDRVEVSVLAFPSRVFQASLSYVAIAIDATTHRLPVRAEVENPDGALKPEMFAKFRIITGKDHAAPAVPISAVVHDGEAAHVWVADAKTRMLEIRPVSLGIIYRDNVQVLDGLKPGEQVVTSGAVFIDRAVSGD